MTLQFKVNFNVSIGRDRLAYGEAEIQMSDKAKRLADEVNRRQSDQEIKSQLQLHKAEILRSKGHAFWNDFAIKFREEVSEFNNHLQNDEYRIDTFDDTSTAYTIKIKSGKSGRDATCIVSIPSQQISATTHRPAEGSPIKYRLAVDHEDNIRILNNAGGGGGVVSESDFIIAVLKLFTS